MEVITHRKYFKYNIFKRSKNLIILSRESMNPYDKKWYKYNDDYVTEIQNMDDKKYKNYGSSSAYMLFYAKKNLFT